MISIPLQFKRVVELAAADAARKRCALLYAEEEANRLHQEWVKSSCRLDKAKKEYDEAAQYVAYVLDKDPAKAVEDYRQLHGKYPV